MKPIQLRLQGLHSFRKEQIIDFSKILDGGVFGIFGPTGSGKSTILDAITLAMYGRIERTGANTIQGILNLLEKKLEVSFTFELQDGSEKKTYRVERVYNQLKDNIITCREARLCELNLTEDKVLGTGSDNVTKKITEIIGLNLDDFTRAIVLPQGKFAEFLKLGSKERAKMLERLFGLEKYGEELNSRLKKQVEKLDSQCNLLKSRQDGVGNASPQALDEAQVNYKNSAAKIELVEKLFSSIEGEYQVWNDVWKWQQELSKVEIDLQELLGKQEEIQKLKLELDNSKRADKLKPLIDAINSTAERKEGTLKTFEEKSRELEVGLNVVKEKHLQFEEFKQKKSDEYPRIQEYRIKVEEAIKMEVEIKKSQKEIDQYDREMHLLLDAEKSLVLQNTSITRNIESDKLLQKSLSEKLAANRIEIKYRDQVQMAMSCLKLLRNAEEELEKANNDRKSSEESLKRAETELSKESVKQKKSLDYLQSARQELESLKSEPKDSDSDLTSAFVAFEDLKNTVSNCKNMIESIDKFRNEPDKKQSEYEKKLQIYERSHENLLHIERVYEECEKNLNIARLAKEEELTKQFLGNLASNLIENVPCPVCGSQEHPKKAQGIDSLAMQRVEKKVMDTQRLLEKYKQELVKCRDEESTLRISMKTAETQVIECKKRIEELEVQKNACFSKLPANLKEHSGTIDIRALESILEAESRKLKDKKRIQENYQLKLTESQKKVESLANDLQNAQSSILHHEKNQAASFAKFTTCADICKKKELNVRYKQQELDSVRKDLLVERIEESYKLIQKKDKDLEIDQVQFEKCMQRVENSEKEIYKIRIEYEQLKSKMAEVQLKSAKAKGDETDKIAKIRQITNGYPADKLIEKINFEIKEFENRFNYAETEFKKSQEKLEEIRAIHEQTKGELGQIEHTMDDLRGKLKAELNIVGFSSIDVAKSWLRSIEVMRNLETKVDLFKRDLEARQQDVNRLTKELKNRKISEVDWSLWQQKFVDGRNDRDKAQIEHATNTERLNSLLAKKEEWDRLEEERLVKQGKLNLLQELKQVLREQAFVEFLAREQLESITFAASQRLIALSEGRYLLKVDAGGTFFIQDNFNASIARAVSSLSGGETFLVSLALALALSLQIQLHGKYPLEFFFLDEGFGTLDSELLQTVINSLERLGNQSLHVGLISHVQELHDRFLRRIIVKPGTQEGEGSTIYVERL